MLELVADNDGAPMRLSALAAAIDAPKSSAHSILRSLLAGRFLELTEDGSYRLGIRAFEVGAAYSRHMSPTRAVHAELVELSHELKVTAHFAILDGPGVLYIEKEDPPGPGIRVASAVGARLPAHLTAVGKAALAYADETSLARADLTVRGNSSQQLTRAGLDHESSPWSVVTAMQWMRARRQPAFRRVAAAVFDERQQCCGAVGVS